MKSKRILLSAALATLLATTGCLRNMCEKHGYYPVAPAPAYPQCCVPCCPCGPAPAGYAAPAAVPAWNAPAQASAGTCVPCCPPPPHQ